MDERIGGIGQGVQYGEWEGAASADSADPEHDRLSELFDTSKTVVAIDIQVLEPITEDRFVIKGYCVSAASDEAEGHCGVVKREVCRVVTRSGGVIPSVTTHRSDG